MRYYGLTLAGVLACAPVYAQQSAPQPNQPSAAPAFDPARNPLDAMLQQWEWKLQGVQTLEATCTRTTVDKTFKTTEVFEGTAKYMKPNLALLDMHKKNQPEVFEKYVSTGTFLYEFRPQSKTIYVHELPPAKPGQVADDNFLSFLFGIKAEEAKRRYELKVEPGKEQDPHYHYILIWPKLPADKADFQRARLVLLKQTFLPRELWFEQPNGNEIKWDIPRIESDGRTVSRNDFNQPATPQGWKVERAPKANAATPTNVPPRLARPKN
jgi:TIGR03009 family protein